jgi:hypothetical protein
LKQPRDRSFRGGAAIGFVAAISGLALIIWSRMLPAYIVPFGEAMQAYDALCLTSGKRDPAAMAHYSSLFGWRYALANAGVSLFLGACSYHAGLILSAPLRSSRPAYPRLRTPVSRGQFLLLGVLAIFLFWVGSIWGLQTDLRRLYFPACADSIGIPISGLTFGLIVISPILILVGLLVTRGFGALPVKLTEWDRLRLRRSWIVSVVFLTLALLNLAVLGASIFSSDIILPAGILTTYLLLATRAALLAPKTSPRTA